jgi:hypothetical protein
MKSGNPLLRSDDFRYFLAVCMALEVLLLFLPIAEPWLSSSVRGDIGAERRLARLLSSWPYFVAGGIYAVSAHVILAKLDEGGAIPRLLFYACLGATLTGTLVTAGLDFDLIWRSQSYSALLIFRLEGSLFIAPLCCAVLAIRLWQATCAYPTKER